MAIRTDDAATQELGVQRDARYAIELKLENGEELRADAGGDKETARTQLAAVQASGSGDGFVILGEDMVVRSREIRYARIVERDADSGHGIIDTVKQHLGGGREMATYDTETSGGAVRVTRAHDADRGAGQPLFGNGRRGGYGETKPFFVTSEFLTLIGAIAAVAVAMAVLDNLDAERGWLLITILAAAYMVSRGIAKAGTRDPNTLDPR